jgi:hypothetical protein
MQLLCASGLHSVVLPDWCSLGGLHCGQEGAGVTSWGGKGAVAQQAHWPELPPGARGQLPGSSM